MSAEIPKIKLNNGTEMPVLGFGTWQFVQMEDAPVQEIISHAIDLGYRLFDCTFFCSEAIGNAFRRKIDQKVVKREDLFVTFKITSKDFGSELEPYILLLLKRLKTTYLDLVLLDTEVFKNSEFFLHEWRSIEELYRKNLFKAVGVSDFNAQEMDSISHGCSVIPQVNQVQHHRKELRRVCEDLGVRIMTSASYYDDKNSTLLKDVAERYGKTPTDILLKYNLQLGNVTMLECSDKNILKENVKIFDFHLAPEDMSYINSFLW